MTTMLRLGMQFACAVLALTACKKEDNGAKVYAQIAASAGIGVPFGTSPDQVHAKLGQPQQTVERGKMVTDYYITVPPGLKEPTMPSDVPAQLDVTYFDKKLVKVYNSYHPETPGAPSPPYVAQPLIGVKLGLKRSELEKLLGKPSYGALKDGWQYVGEDGGMVIVQPIYTMVENMGDKIVSALSVEHTEESADLGKGEYYKKKKERQESIHNLTTK